MLKKLSQSLRETRKQRGLTQAQIAGEIGISLRTYLRLEAGDGGVKISTYAWAAARLGLDLTLVAHRKPTLDELDELYGDD